MSTAHLSHISQPELKAAYATAKALSPIARYSASALFLQAHRLRLAASKALPEEQPKLKADVEAAFAEYEEAAVKSHQLMIECLELHEALTGYAANSIAVPLAPAVEPESVGPAPTAEPAAGAHADLVEALTFQPKLKVWNPTPVRVGLPYHFGHLRSASRNLDLLCGAYGDGLLTCVEGAAPQLVIPARHFTLSDYNLTDPSSLAAAKAYVRRKIQAFAPI